MGTEQSTLTSKISSEELGELRCSDLDLPMFPPYVFEPIFSTFLCKITNRRWMTLAAGNIDKHTVTLLSNMCHTLVDEISISVLQVVAPQVLAWVQDHISQTSASSSTDTRMKRNYHHVTEEDIQATLGDSLHHSFAEALGVKQDLPHTDKLAELFSAEVEKRVNQQLDLIREPVSCTHPEESPVQTETSESPTSNMVYLIANILKCATEVLESEDEDEGSLDSSCSVGLCPDEMTDVEVFKDEDTIAGPVSWTPRKNLSQPTDNLGSNLSGGWGSDPLMGIENYTDDSDEPIPLSERESTDLSADLDNTFLTVVLGKLLEHIADSTKTSMFEVDFEGMLARLRERTGGKLNSTLPKTIGKIHISIYKTLCREFGSAELLQAAIVSGDETFEDALIKTLKVQLQKSTEETSSLVMKVKRFFSKRTAKTSPACEISDNSVSETSDSGSMHLPPREQRQPSIRMFSTMAKFLRKTFSSCIGDGSQDD